MNNYKVVRISLDSYIAIERYMKNNKYCKSFSAYIEQAISFFENTHTDPFFIKDVPTVEIKRNTEKALKDIERVIKILKAQEKEYKSLFATKNDLPKPSVSDKYIENITIEQLEEQGLSNDELLSLVDAAQENNAIIKKQEKRIQELEMLIAGNNISAIKKPDDLSSNDENILSIDFKEAFTHFLINEKDLKETIFIKISDESNKYLNIINQLSQNLNDEKKQAYKRFFEIIIFKKEFKSYIVARDDMREYYNLKNKLLS